MSIQNCVGLAEIEGEVDGEIDGELEGVADFVGEIDGLGELVGGRVLLPPSQMQQCSVAGPISPA